MAGLVIIQSHSFTCININNRHFILNILNIFEHVILASITSELTRKTI
jgi:hypothetical protein